MSKLVIVESPAKAKTIEKYLGSGYKVMASMGHIRDLPKSLLGVDIENHFKPRYMDIPGKTALIRQIKSEAASSDGVLLATDPDREGEAISWHLAQILKVDMNENNRITFNEITKNGVKQGMANPRCLDMNLVNAQQARRILDRIVGYQLSPLLRNTGPSTPSFHRMKRARPLLLASTDLPPKRDESRLGINRRQTAF